MKQGQWFSSTSDPATNNFMTDALNEVSQFGRSSIIDGPTAIGYQQQKVFA